MILQLTCVNYRISGGLMGFGDIIRSKIAGNPVIFMMEKYTLVVVRW
jgi:hypothetical protein